ncbi:TetR/AcrR family transcriptional regulator [Synechococcus sp. H65.1]|uniref:TetR/AcrR family transcriptional regulator n=1 Tax=unclassified Synechococcus TaxID=2626047 RepID=UPI0039C473EF
MARPSSRQRLLKAARELFVRQGIAQTTTRQIADLAGVHEVTLFRHFGSKQGLLLAVFAELGVFSGVADLPLPADPTTFQSAELQAILLRYVQTCFQALADNPELVRSLVGEAGSYSEEHRRALRAGFLQAQEQLCNYLKQIPSPDLQAIDSERLHAAAGALHLMILGAALLAVTAGLPCSNTDQPSSNPADKGMSCPGVPALLQACVELWMAALTGMKQAYSPP